MRWILLRTVSFTVYEAIPSFTTGKQDTGKFRKDEDCATAIKGLKHNDKTCKYGCVCAIGPDHRHSWSTNLTSHPPLWQRNFPSSFNLCCSSSSSSSNNSCSHQLTLPLYLLKGSPAAKQGQNTTKKYITLDKNSGCHSATVFVKGNIKCGCLLSFKETSINHTWGLDSIKLLTLIFQLKATLAHRT